MGGQGYGGGRGQEWNGMRGTEQEEAQEWGSIPHTDLDLPSRRSPELKTHTNTCARFSPPPSTPRPILAPPPPRLLGSGI